MKLQTLEVLKKKDSSILIFHDRVYLKLADLHLIFKMPRKFVEDNILTSLKVSDTYYIDNSYWMLLSAISTEIRRLYPIPSAMEFRSKYFSFFPNAEKKYNHQIYLYQAMLIALKKTVNYAALIEGLNGDANYFLGDISRSNLAFEFLKDLKSVSVKDKFFLYLDVLSNRKEGEMDSFMFVTKSLSAFKNKFSQFRKIGVRAFIHGNKENNNAAVKFDDKDRKILKTYKNGIRKSFRTITKELNTNRTLRGAKRVSVQTVIKIIKDAEDHGVLLLQRSGSEEADKLLFHPCRLQPDYPADQYQIDGSQVKIPFINEEGKPDLLILVAAIDVFSKKIVGHTLTRSETFRSYFDVISQSVTETKCLPAEILSDNLPALNSKESKNYQDKLKALGVLIRKHKPLNPSDKSAIENWFGIFNQHFLKDVPGFLGDGIRSRRKDGKPNSDLTRDYRKMKNLRTRSELKELLREKIIEYNSTYEIKNSTPHLLFANSVLTNAIKLDEEHLRVVLFEEKLCMLSKAGIKIQVKKKTFEYIIYEDNIPFLLKFLEKEIVLRYDPLNMDTIYLYPVTSFLHGTKLSLHPKFPLAQVNQSDDDKKWIREFGLKRNAMKKKLHQICFANTESDESIPIELLSEKSDPKDVVNEAIKSIILPKRKAYPQKVVKVVSKLLETDDGPVEGYNPIKISTKMFNLPGSNRRIN